MSEQAKRPLVYLAGPEVFHENALELGARKKAICAAYGLEGLFPLDNEIAAENAAPAELAARIYDANIAMLDRADGVIANATPFLGATTDDGTAFEIGYAVAKGLPLALYDNGVGDTASKARRFEEDAPALADPALSAEDFGLPVNLMMAIAAERGVGLFAGAEPLSFDDLGRFESAVTAMAARLITFS